ncbi:MAG: hypothetical protein M1541_10715, partial [Acidobacteria bacterium]|nr:hypothetical protein [Acidobacteriota bacterium]
MLAVSAAGLAAEGWIDPEFRGARLRQAGRLGILAASCAAASLLNPYGYRLHVHVASYLKSDWIRTAVQEFQSPSFREETMAHFEVLLVVGLLCAANYFRRKQVVEALWVLMWTHAALTSVRHVPLYIAVVTPLIAAEATRWWEAAVDRRPRRSLPAILKALGDDSAPGFRRLTAWAVLPVLVLAAIGEPVKWPSNFPKEKFPVEIVERHRAALAASRVLTSDQWADYLIFRSYPAQKVFFDGRSDFYGPELGREYIRMVQAHHSWEALLERYGFEYVLGPMDWPLTSILKKDPRWRIVEDDHQAVLFERVRAKPVPPKADPEKTAARGLMKKTEVVESTRGDHRG